MAKHNTKVTAQTPTQKAGTSFWSTAIRWEEIWKAKWWIVSSLILFHALGLSVNHGPSMNYLGWVYATNWFSSPEKDGQIFRFAPADLPAWCKYLPWCTQVKRRVSETPDGRVVFEGDNSEWSKDCRDGLKPVPEDHIAGVVYAAISPRRIVNTFTNHGRLYNWAEFHYPPKKHIVVDRIVATVFDGKFCIYDGYTITDLGPAYNYASGAVKPIEYRNGRFVYKPTKKEHEYAVFDPSKQGPARHYVFNVLAVLPDVINGDTLNGVAVVKPGASVIVSQPTTIEITESSEVRSVPTAEIDGVAHQIPMSTVFEVQKSIRNIGTGAFCVKATTSRIALH